MIRYLSAEQIQWIHRRVIEATGGNHRTRDPNLVQSSAVRPSGGVGSRDTYRTLPEKAAALVESLVLYHPFVDGNKRTALVAAGIFLESNGHTLSFRPAAAEQFLRRLAAGHMRFAEVVRWVERSCVPLRRPRASAKARVRGARRGASRAGRRPAARRGAGSASRARSQIL